MSSTHSTGICSFQWHATNAKATKSRFDISNMGLCLIWYTTFSGGMAFLITDIGQESAYTCKLLDLPPGTSKGLLHFVQYKGNIKSH
jgi:hypothetical protein